MLFDWGGVFTVGTFDGRVVRTLAQHFGLEEARVAEAYFARVAHLEVGAWSLAEFWEALAEALGVEAPYASFELLFLSCVAPRHEMYALLAAWPPELRVGLLSNNYPVISQYLRSGPHFDRFDAVVFSNEEGVKKPDPRAFQLALERLELPAEAVLFVDDNAENLEAARQLGFRTHHFQDPEGFRAALKAEGVTLPAAPQTP